MKLAEPVSVFLEEDKHKQGQKFIADTCYWACSVVWKFKFYYFFLFTFHLCEQVTEHVIMLKEISNKQGCIFWKYTLIFFVVTKLEQRDELPDKIMCKIVQNCKDITFHLA